MRPLAADRAGLPALILLALLVAGCATTGSVAPPDGSAAADGGIVVEPAVQAEYERALVLLDTGDYEGAEALLGRFVEVHASFPGAWTNLAIIYRRTERPDQAADALARALTLDETYPPALNQQGVMHREAGRFEQAEAAYLKAVTAQPEYPLAHFNLGVLNDLYLGSPENALTHYERYQALTGGDDEMVAMWIVDIRRRLGIEAQSARAD